MNGSPVLCPCGTRNRVPPSASGVPRCAKCKKPLPWLVEAGDADFEDLAGATVPVLVDFWATWCGPCRVVGPAVEAAATAFAGRLKVVKLDVDQAPAVSARYGVQSIPTLLLRRPGRPDERQVGALSGPALTAWLERELSRPAAAR